MKRIAFATAVAALAAGPAAAGELTWHFFGEDNPSGFLAVIDADQLENPEAHFPFLMTCAADQDWQLFVSDVDARTLGEAIAKGEQPTFALSVTTGDKTETSGDFFPEITFSQMEGVWEYSSIWDAGLLDHLLLAEHVALKGTGVERPLPDSGLREAVPKFKSYCENLPDQPAEGDPDNGAP